MTGLFSYKTNNIGDDFQSYVLQHYLAINAEDLVYVSRDEPDKYVGPKVKLLINAFVTKMAFPIHPKLDPVFLAAWLGPMVMGEPEIVEFLKQHGSIGCRDTDTLERCIDNGIDAYFTGCPTILCKPLQQEKELEDSVLFVDVNPKLFTIDAPIAWSTNVVSNGLANYQRWEECSRRHKLMTQAQTIVTNRIHVAIPALGMGKAVIFVEDDVPIPGRLTALPPQVRRYTPDQFKNIRLEPDEHRYDVTEYKMHVEEMIKNVL